MNAQKRNSPLQGEISQADIEASKRLLEVFEKRKKSLGLSQVSLARLLKISQPAVHKYLHGKIPLNVKMIIAFANALHVKPTDIHTGYDKLLSSFQSGQLIKQVATLFDLAQCRLETRVMVNLRLFTSKGVLTLRLETQTFPGYEKGQFVVFDTEQEGNKERDAVAHYQDNYCIARFNGTNWIRTDNEKVLDFADLKTYSIDSTHF